MEGHKDGLVLRVIENSILILLLRIIFMIVIASCKSL